MKRYFLAPLLALSLSVSGCTSLASFVAGTATSMSTQTPSQVTTLAEADLAADTIVRLARVAVDTDKLDAGTLKEMQALRQGLRDALDVLHAANDHGQSISFASFNAALQAYRAYATVKGLPA